MTPPLDHSPLIAAVIAAIIGALGGGTGLVILLWAGIVQRFIKPEVEKIVAANEQNVATLNARRTQIAEAIQLSVDSTKGAVTIGINDHQRICNERLLATIARINQTLTEINERFEALQAEVSANGKVTAALQGWLDRDKASGTHKTVHTGGTPAHGTKAPK